MHAPVYWLVFHVAAQACRLDTLHTWVEAWLARRAPPGDHGRLLAAVARLDVCYASVRELPLVRPRSVLGGPVGAEEAHTLALADQALIARARPRVAPDVEALWGLAVLGAAFSAGSAGVIHDPQRRMLLPLDFANEPPALDPLELALRLGIPGIRHTAHGAVTEGLGQFGLPELLLPGVEPFERDAAAALLRATSARLLESGLRERITLPQPSDGLALEVTLSPTSKPSVLEVRPRVPQRALLPTFRRAEGQVVFRGFASKDARRRLLRRAMARSTLRFCAPGRAFSAASRRHTWQSEST